MKLKYKYIVGCHVLWYEIKMLPEYVQSIVNSVEGIENPENITIDFCWNEQEYLEKYDGIVFKVHDRTATNYPDSIIIEIKRND